MLNISTKSGISSFLPKTLKNSSAKIHTLQAHGILWHRHLEPCFSTFVIIVALLRDLLRHYFHTCLAWSFNTTDMPYIYVPHVYLCLYIKRISFLLLRIIFLPFRGNEYVWFRDYTSMFLQNLSSQSYCLQLYGLGALDFLLKVFQCVKMQIYRKCWWTTTSHLFLGIK